MAATQTTNNNSIRSIIKKEKLNGSNFLDWYHNLRIVLKNEQKLHHLEEALPEAPPANATAVVRNAYTRRVDEQQEVACLMLVSLTLKIQKNLEDRAVFEILQELKTMFQQQAKQELFKIVKAFHACKQEEGQSASTYVLKMKSYSDQMERLGYPTPLVLGVNLILTSLSKDYDQFVQNYNMYGMGKTIPELHAMLKLAEKGIPKKTPAVLAIRQGQIQKPKSQARGKGKQRGKGKSKLAYDPKHKIPPPAKKEHPAKDTKCIFTIELFSFPKSNTWIYDTGCGTHICNTIQGLRGYRKLNKGALDLYVGNGHSAAVEAIGSFELILPSGMILIDMHNHISNEHSIYTCSNKKSKHNLDSTFLWYCCLGYINKKRIEKLQHDGLLKSINDESFDVCVSCISGKMARKPFTHASERADDLLGIIHSNGYALESTTRILNMVPTKKVNKIPYEMWHGKVPNLSYLKVWGCEALVKRDMPNKLKSRSIKCIFIGYQKETMGYYFYYPLENKIFVARCAEFFKTNLIKQEASGSIIDFDEIQREDA
ncbi:zinc finger, CCHC-type containing protein [Tanacetum coccineum]